MHGGDINETFLLNSSEGKLVVKLNATEKFPAMFEKETNGLKLLKQAEAFEVPEAISFDEVEHYSYLLLPYNSSAPKNENFWKLFAESLAKLHRCTQSHFGLDHDNFIGSLPQYNQCSIETAAEFYIEKRMEPQFKMAHDNGFQFKNLSSFYKNISNEIPDEAPALIHGDLWNGNYMVSEDGKPVLIDPAVAFAPREMDLGMMKLFGGYSTEVFQQYNSIFPLQKNWKARIEIWQLYYLLVHLNIFGSGYYQSVSSIVKKFS